MTAAVAPRVLLSIPVSAILTRAMKIGLIGGALVVCRVIHRSGVDPDAPEPITWTSLLGATVTA
jgi:hypothetical protein